MGKKCFYVDWSACIMAGEEIGRVESGISKVAIHKGTSIEVIESNRVFETELEACRFAIQQLNFQYKSVSERAESVMKRMAAVEGVHPSTEETK